MFECAQIQPSLGGHFSPFSSRHFRIINIFFSPFVPRPHAYYTAHSRPDEQKERDSVLELVQEERVSEEICIAFIEGELRRKMHGCHQFCESISPSGKGGGGYQSVQESRRRTERDRDNLQHLSVSFSLSLSSGNNKVASVISGKAKVWIWGREGESPSL